MKKHLLTMILPLLLLSSPAVKAQCIPGLIYHYTWYLSLIQQ